MDLSVNRKNLDGKMLLMFLDLIFSARSSFRQTRKIFRTITLNTLPLLKPNSIFQNSLFATLICCLDQSRFKLCLSQLRAQKIRTKTVHLALLFTDNCQLKLLLYPKPLGVIQRG